MIETVVQKRYTVKEVAEHTGLDNSYIARLLSNEEVKTYLQYDGSKGFPAASVYFFEWLADTARPDYVKATPKNAALVLKQYRDEHGVPGSVGEMLPDMQRGNRMTERDAGYAAGNGSVPARQTDQENNTALALVKSMDRLTEAIQSQPILQPPDDELLSGQEVVDRFLKFCKPAGVSRYIKPWRVKPNMYRRSDVLRYLAGMGSGTASA